MLESTACPDLSSLDHAHAATCMTCRMVLELLEERKHGLADRDRRAECERFELLLAAREEGTIGGSAATLLDEHLRSCADCAVVAATIAPSDRPATVASLPAVSTSAYALGREVARGGMGRILAAQDLRIGRPVAVKELLGKSPSLAARFEREARVTARLQHPGIVPIYEVGKWPDGTPFYAMRMVEGRTLREALRDKPTLDARLELLSAVIAAAEAVAFAHDKRIIHRDLTPNNILVGAYGDTVVIDWGLAKDLSTSEDELAEGPYRDEPSTAGDLTNVGAVIGTVAYMPPEQACGEPVDERADVYALGAILYHVLAGTAPYRATGGDPIVRQVQDRPPTPIVEIAAGAPRDLVSIVSKAMARDAAERYPTARELADELRRFQTGRVVEAHEYSKRERLRRWIRAHRASVLASVASLVMLAVVGSIGLAGVFAARDRAEAREREATEQRALADSSKVKAQRENAHLMEEQGRQELLAGNTTRAIAWLNEAYRVAEPRESLRFLLGTAMGQIESVEHMFDCGGRMDSVEISSDGALLLAACEYGIKIWRLSDGELIQHIVAATSGATFSHDGRRIASKRWAWVTMFDAETGAELFSKREHTDQIRTMTFTPDDRYLVTAGDDAKVRIWDAAGAVLHVMDAGSGKMNVVRHDLTSDGKTIVTHTADGRVVTWDVATGVQRKTFRLHVQAVAGITSALSPDGTRFVACGTDGTVSVWDLDTGTIAFEVIAHTNGTFACAFSPDGRKILSTGLDGLARIWEVSERRLLATLDHGGQAVKGRFSPDGRVATLSVEGRLKIWHPATGTLISSVDQPSPLQEILAFTPDGSRLITAHAPSTIVVARPPTIVSPRQPPATSSVVRASPTARHLALRDAKGALSIVRAADLVPVSTEAMREPLSWSADGRCIAAVTPSGGVIVLDVTNGTVLSRIPFPAPPVGVELDGSGKRLLSVGVRVEIWNLSTARVELAVPERIHASTLSRDGTRFLAWTDPTSIEVWDIGLGRVILTLHPASPLVNAVGFDSDLRHVVLAEQDTDSPVPVLSFLTRLAIYDIANGARVYAQSGRLFPMLDPSGRRVSSSGMNLRHETRSATNGQLLASFTPDLNFLVVGSTTPDGSLLVLDDTSGISVRSGADGRLLASVRTQLRNVTYTQDSLNYGSDNFDMSADGRTVIVHGTDPVVWQLPRETRSPEEIDRIIRANIAWRVIDGKLRLFEASARGRVLRHGTPVAGAEVAIHEGVSWRRVVTDPQGRYEIAELGRGAHIAIAMSPDHDAHGSQAVTIGDGDVTQDIVLDADASIEGQVVDELGQPVPNAPVHAVRADGIAAYPDPTTDAAGRFVIRALVYMKFTVFVPGGSGFVNLSGNGVPVDLTTNHHVTGVRLVARRDH